MSKPNISHEDGAWDLYQDKTPELALAAIYAHAAATANTTAAWYWASIHAKRRTSVWLRVVAFVALVVGTILPVTAAMFLTPEMRLDLTQCGVGALAFGGLMQLADKAFGFSSGWMRYVTTVTAIEARTHQFQLDWAGILTDKLNPLMASDVIQLFALSKEFEGDVVKLQSDETDKWVAEFNGGLAVLDSAIKAQREAGDKAVEAARVTVVSARQTGAIELVLKHAEAVAPVHLSLDDVFLVEFTGQQWSKIGISVGQHKLSIQTNGPVPRHTEQVVDVANNATTRLEVAVVGSTAA